MSHSALLSIVARLHPEAVDAIIPHSPAIRAAARFDRVALNPQPLPPRDAFVVGAAEVAHEIVRKAVDIEAGGGSSRGYVSEAIDDFCGTPPWPRKIPLPWPWPEPDPSPWWQTVDVRAAQVVAAIVFASAAARLQDEEFRSVFAEGAERLAAAAVDGPVAARSAGKAGKGAGRRGKA
jgi:hypothetical protein